MYINAVAGSVVLYLQHDVYNIIFKIIYQLYIVSSSAPFPPRKNSGSHHTKFSFLGDKVPGIFAPLPWLTTASFYTFFTYVLIFVPFVTA
jgi:hypothetical protein